MKPKKLILSVIIILVIFLLIGILLVNTWLKGEEQPIPPQNITDVTVSTSMTFGVIIDSASYRYPGHDNGPVDLNNAKKEVDAAKELGVDFVRFDIRNEMLEYPKEIQKLDDIIDYARSKNLEIYIGVYGMESWMGLNMWLPGHAYGGSGKADWNEFRNMYTSESKNLAERYKPDYMMIMVECPFNVGNQLNTIRTTEEWVNYTKEVAAMIKSISPDTKLVLNQIVRKGGGPHENSEFEFTEAIISDNTTQIDIIGADPYSLDDLEDQVSNLLHLKKKYNWHGDIWIGETNLLATSRLFRRSTLKEDENQKKYFIYAIYLAAKNNFDGFCIFYFRDGTNDAGMGIMYDDFAPKPAYNAIKKILQNTTMPFIPGLKA
ncbi:MAG: hypothetical protein DRN71_02780 [Candidatus Nanohalarchaeota archaeon]|nr:MAG: hypothetical protein DRN71_02780 [Candidatus Nanohaloarchaeota archaeon]